MAAVTSRTARSYTGVVVSAGRMMKTVRVRIADQTWNKKLRKHFQTPRNIPVADPTSSLREGDLIQLVSGWRTSKTVRHVVTSIIAPFGSPASERPPILSEAERLTIREQRRLEKDGRQAARGRPAALARVRRREMEGKEVKVPGSEEVNEGGPSGGEMEMPDINERAMGNKNAAAKLIDKAVENVEELRDVIERTRGKGRIADEVARGGKGIS
ncbi:nucleic acid-binding protein [Patellaria atrata CBS 101060]|uniref:Nucleic acid-binding protein n=1 Tax=Patellaria atrata CBS 101060 TaxID=1346257 RepID=A0A9P4S2K7_9PEZI|nr:nucleic acid-binding protein [Patellaria atrata CBS 101060]